MKEQEILKYIGYNGEYTKDVKKKLNKLIKKYHPDRNKDDKKTILTLYEVKRKIENNTIKVDYDQSDAKETYKGETEDNYFNDLLINRIINILFNQKKFNEKQLTKIYNRAYYYDSKNYDLTNKINQYNLDIEILEEQIKIAKNINIVDVLTLIEIIVILLVKLILPKTILVVLIFIIILIELANVASKYQKIKFLKEILSKNKKIKDELILKKAENDDNIKTLKNEELSLKRQKTNINNDIQFYNNELTRNDSINQKNVQKK